MKTFTHEDLEREELDRLKKNNEYTLTSSNWRTYTITYDNATTNATNTWYYTTGGTTSWR